MSLPSIDRFKNGFFDRGAVIGALGKGEAQALSKGGAYIRTEARSSLRYRLNPSPVGSPPSVHRDDRPGGLHREYTKKDGTTARRPVSPLKEFIFFAWDSDSKSVIIGPAATNQRNAQGYGGRSIPNVLEEGGMVRVFEHRCPTFRGSSGSTRGRGSGPTCGTGSAAASSVPSAGRDGLDCSASEPGPS